MSQTSIKAWKMVRLVYDWNDGWAPLAHFLQVPVPEKEFPHRETWLAGADLCEKFEQHLKTHAQPHCVYENASKTTNAP